MARIQSLSPILPHRPEVLILGSIPGIASLEKQEYYAHPSNAFWPIIGQLLDFPHTLPYELRVKALRDARIALWDVLRTCERSGSLDSNIVPASEHPNAIGALLRKHRSFKAVFLNGGKAHAAFHRHISPSLDPETQQRLTVARMPSTSPANAKVSRVEKTHAWRGILRYLQERCDAI